MKMVPFTDYRRPNGEREEIEMPVADELGPKVDAILAAGLKFECEYLTTGDWSFTIADREKGVDVAIELLFRSKMVPDARTAAIGSIEKMIREYQL